MTHYKIINQECPATRNLSGVSRQSPLYHSGAMRTHHFAGFTILEMLLAMVLTVILLTGLMMVASASAQDQRRLIDRSNQAEPVWIDPIARQIESDLLMAVGISETIPTLSYTEHTGRRTSGGGERIYIVTYNAFSKDGTTTHAPVFVSYTLVDSEIGGVLLRRQQTLTSSDGIGPASHRLQEVQVLATGIDEITIGGNTLHLRRPMQRTSSAPRTSEAFTILIDGRPIQLHPITAQVQLSITLTAEHRSESANDSTTQARHYQRVLLTR